MKILTSEDICDARRLCINLDRLSSSTVWPKESLIEDSNAYHRLTQYIHYYNSLLWLEEDLARRKHAADSEIVANKRAIDSYNQLRNNSIEKLDACLFELLSPSFRLDESVRSSETPGAMIDRLSILSLKIYHTNNIASLYLSDDSIHSELRDRVTMLRSQRDDLSDSVDRLFCECRSGRMYFKLYKQLKMYNDSRFNPAVLAESRTLKKKNQ